MQSGTRSRVLLGRGAFDEAIVCTLQELGLSRDQCRRSCWRLALSPSLAHAGQATHLLQQKRRFGCRTGTDAAVIGACTRAVVATHDTRSDAFAVVSDALSTSRKLGSIGGLVAALRGCPEIGALLMDDPETRRELMPILALSNESGRYPVLSDKPSSGSAAWRDLSKARAGGSSARRQRDDESSNCHVAVHRRGYCQGARPPHP